MGLTLEQVQQRVDSGQVNVDSSTKSRSLKRIFYSNICTLFNLINVILAGFVFVTGSYKNMLFIGIIIINTAIGIVQEIRSKRSTDKLSIVVSTKATVIREGKPCEISLEEIVIDDIVVLGRGDQIPSDSVVVSGTCAVDESLLTGESKLVPKQADSPLMSGSFINSGLVYVKVVHVGADNYAAKLGAEAKQYKAINSDIMNSLKRIIKFVSIIIFPLGIALFSRVFFTGVHVSFDEAILSTVAALIGMIPEGLILLTSIVLAVAVIRLSQQKVLVQQLYCIETLARVDTLCLDKTGTITTGALEVDQISTFDDCSQQEVESAFYTLVKADEDPNETAQAIIAHFDGGKGSFSVSQIERFSVEQFIPFSSDKKWSAIRCKDGLIYVMGAAQFVLGKGFAAIEDRVAVLSKNARVLVLARADGIDNEGNIAGLAKPLALIAIHDQIRSTASQTIAYFIEQGVDPKVISGDDPVTVSGIAEKVGIPNATHYIDMTTIKSDEALVDAISRYQVFGRVTPEQKKKLVKALQDQGHVVAMTGDGVNDVLALKQADTSVVMAAGSDAARNIAQLVLVDNNFASMPKVVSEGRRAINNLQRSASLFLIKTVLSIVLAVCFILSPWQYPFQPIQMTLVSAFTIGLPSFVLALEPNRKRIEGEFFRNVITRSLPGSLTAIAAILIANAVSYLCLGLSYEQVSTLSILLFAWVGVLLIARISMPFTPIRIALLIVVVLGLIIGSLGFPSFFSITPFTFEMAAVFVIIAAAAIPLFFYLYRAFGEWHEKKKVSKA